MRAQSGASTSSSGSRQQSVRSKYFERVNAARPKKYKYDLKAKERPGALLWADEVRKDCLVYIRVDSMVFFRDAVRALVRSRSHLGR